MERSPHESKKDLARGWHYMAEDMADATKDIGGDMAVKWFEDRADNTVTETEAYLAKHAGFIAFLSENKPSPEE